MGITAAAGIAILIFKYINAVCYLLCVFIDTDVKLKEIEVYFRCHFYDF